ncbi:hypothetical protein AX16_009796 [Volvariella volvacea WC 439]|nr:hypothetical protein AX16_009796 [Volvariella volvacea WC 439]
MIMSTSVSSPSTPTISSITARGPSCTFIPNLPTTRAAIITGAAQGIGRSIAIRLAKDDISLVVNDLPEKQDLLAIVVSEIERDGHKALAAVGDVSKEVDVKRIVETCVKEYGRLDIMIANAGIAGAGTIMDADVEKWETLFATNIRGTILCYKYAAIQMVKQGLGGRIIGASSVSGLRGYAGFGAYCTSKASIRSLTQTAALEFGPYKITVNAYAPGVIETEMTTHPDDAHFGGPTCRLKHILKVPEAGVGHPEDVAGLVSFLCSSEASFITGQTISMNGGLVFN